MTIQTTIWKPSFCDCEIYYTWDDSVPESERTHTTNDNTKKCDIHSSLSDNQTIYTSAIEECKKYIDAKELIIENSPSTFYNITPDNRKILKSGIEILASYSGAYPDRILNLSYSGTTLTTNQRNSVQNKLNTIFGTGKVILT